MFLSNNTLVTHADKGHVTVVMNKYDCFQSKKLSNDKKTYKTYNYVPK